MSRYHINKKGEPGICSAEVKCPLGGGEEQHYSTPEKARQAFELSMAGETIQKPVTKKSFAEQSRDEYKAEHYDYFSFDQVTYDEGRRRKNAVRTGDYSAEGTLSEYMEHDYKKWESMTRTELPKKKEEGVPARLIGEGSVIEATDPLTGKRYRAQMLPPRLMGNTWVARYRDPYENVVTASGDDLVDVVLPTDRISNRWKVMNRQASKIEIARNKYNEDMVTRLLAE